MKRFRKIYLEITNLCNLQCSFCPGTNRHPMRMGEDSFLQILGKIRPYTDFLYFHLMGEPLSHPALERYLDLAGQQGFRVILTTNGTLLPRHPLQNYPGLHKVNISLHSFEANEAGRSFSDYLDGCIRFAKQAQGQFLIVYRLWNDGGANCRNPEILDTLRKAFSGEWIITPKGTRIADRVYLEYGEKFDWPDAQAPEAEGRFFCYALRDQLGILCDGTVVPCCLDHDGNLALGNILNQPMDDILASPRATAIYDGFSQGKATESLCRRCGYAARFRR